MDLASNNAAFLTAAKAIVNTIGGPESASPTSTATVVGILQDLRKYKLVIDSMIVHICNEIGVAVIVRAPATPVPPGGHTLQRTERFFALERVFAVLAQHIVSQIDSGTVMTAWVLRQLPCLQRRCEEHLVVSGQV